MKTSRKLWYVVAILAAGLLPAWPFRKAVDAPDAQTITHSRPTATNPADTALPFATTESIPVISARTQSLGESPASNGPEPTRPVPSFDLVNHPALQDEEARLLEDSAGEVQSENESEPVAASLGDSRPAYNTIPTPSDPLASASWPEEIKHIVRNGDTLEKLADRYLGDSGRALDIFDLNRDQMQNPHLLPIGIELRIPADSQRVLD